MEILDRCIRLAVEAHSGQVYRGYTRPDEPYILHPLRVMLRMQTDEERQVAVLHDVLEDTPCTAMDLYRMGVENSVVKACEDLRWDKERETYQQYIQRIALSTNPYTRPVKIADLRENLSRNPPEGLAQRYRWALAELGEVARDESLF